MALKLLNPGLRPLGQFDLDGGPGVFALDGGEYVELQADNLGTIEGYAADVGAFVNPATGGIVNFTPKVAVAASLGGLADEGTDEYGTLFGSQIGGNVGRQTQFGAAGAAVVMGPRTDAASGKVTVWHQPGLYGVSSGNTGACQLDTDSGVTAGIVTTPIAPNTALNAVAAGGATNGDLTTGGGGAAKARYVAASTDTSLVSTTSRAVGDGALIEFHAVYFLGNA